MANLDTLARGIRKKILNDFDAMCCVTGREGIGKSTMAYWLCKLVDPDFDVKTRIVYALPQLNQRIYNTPRYGAVLVDEGMECFYKRDWHNPARKRVLKTLAMSRQQNLFYVFCTPRFTDLDELLRNWRIRIWVRMVGRGKGKVYFYDDKEVYGDPWHLRDAKLRRKRNLWRGITCGPMPEKDHSKYLEIKTRTFERIGSGDLDQRGTLAAGRLALALHEKKRISYADMERLTGIPQGTIRWYTRQFKATNISEGIGSKERA